MYYLALYVPPTNQGNLLPHLIEHCLLFWWWSDIKDFFNGQKKQWTYLNSLILIDYITEVEPPLYLQSDLRLSFIKHYPAPSLSTFEREVCTIISEDQSPWYAHYWYEQCWKILYGEEFVSNARDATSYDYQIFLHEYEYTLHHSPLVLLSWEHEIIAHTLWVPHYLIYDPWVNQRTTIAYDTVTLLYISLEKPSDYIQLLLHYSLLYYATHYYYRFTRMQYEYTDPELFLYHNHGILLIDDLSVHSFLKEWSDFIDQFKEFIDHDGEYFFRKARLFILLKWQQDLTKDVWHTYIDSFHPLFHEEDKR